MAMNTEEIREATEKDATMPATIQAIRYGWWYKAVDKPNVNAKVLESFKKVKHMLTVSDKIILHGRVVIPASLQQRAVNQAHEGHQWIV